MGTSGSGVAIRNHNNRTKRIDVLANDHYADGDALKAIVINGPKHGSLTNNARIRRPRQESFHHACDARSFKGS
jgi:hypothetical protein